MPPRWDDETPGLLRLPSGRRVRGRGLRRPMESVQLPSFGLYLTGREPVSMPWELRWIRWPDFWLPSDREMFRSQLRELWERSEQERVEVACGGGYGRTGTALACLAVMDGVPASRAVTCVREHYSRRAVETPWQRHFVTTYRSN